MKTSVLSLNARVLLAASAVLASFFGLAGFTLDRAYRSSAEEALKERLQAQVYALIASASVDDVGRVYMHAETPLFIAGANSYAQISDSRGKVVWQSPFLEEISLPFATELSRNQKDYKFAETSGQLKFALYSLGVAWDDVAFVEVYTFSVAENLDGFNAQVAGFRANLWQWLGGVAMLLLAVQGAILRLGLAPLAQVANELAAIEAGRQHRLEHKYPMELTALTNNVNALLAHQHEHLDRYRHTLDDLAHSLKTPLAVLQSTVEEHSMDDHSWHTVQEQVDRMVQITEYQLQRAATAGQTPLLAPVNIHEIVDKVCRSLFKVYAEKSVYLKKHIDSALVFHGDESDLMEIIGNLSDNAFKWCKNEIVISASQMEHEIKHIDGTCLKVEDNGPGIPDKLVKQVVQRGVRIDQGVSGQGIGLAVIQDIVQIYGGELKIDKSRLGGARVSVWLPDPL